jgi:DNA polymerase-3 subunit alpha
MGECRKMDVEVVRPDVNTSQAEFTVAGGKILFGLGAIKGVGMTALQSLVDAREKRKAPFASLFDLCEAVDLSILNRAGIEALLKAGALDSLSARRSQLIEGIGPAMQAGNRAQKDRDSGQLGLFGSALPKEVTPAERLPDIPEWPETQILAFEKEVLGFYVTSHPLAAHEEVIRAFSTTGIGALAEMEDGRKVTFGGMFTEIREKFPRAGRNMEKKMALVRIEDFEGSVSGVIFSEHYARFQEHVGVDRIVFVEGTLDKTREDPSVKIDRVIPIERAFQELAGCVTIRIPEKAGTALLGALKELLEQHRGTCPVYFEVSPLPTVRAIFKLPATISVLATPRFVEAVEGLVGKGAVTFSSTARPSNNGNGLRVR